MDPVTTREALAQRLDRPQPVAWVDGLLARAPQVRCYLGPTTLGEVCRWSVGPAALRWRDGTLRSDPAAVALARLRAAVWRDAAGTPLASDDWPARLPAGVVDRLLDALDRAGGYRPPEPSAPPPGTDRDPLAAYAAGSCRWLRGLPQDPAAGLCVHAYDFAALAAGEAAATLAVPGGEVRVEVLAWPCVVAASLRGGEDPAAPLLADEALARRLPYGLARAIVETADLLSELGGPTPGVRFRDDAAGPGLDRAGAVAAAADRPAAQ